MLKTIIINIIVQAKPTWHANWYLLNDEGCIGNVYPPFYSCSGLGSTPEQASFKYFWISTMAYQI